MIRLIPAFAFVGLLTLPALAQEGSAPTPPAAARCTGVLCDLYYANKPVSAPGQPETPDPTHLPCHDFLCAAFGGRTPDAPSSPVEQAASPAPAAPAHATRHKRVARKNVSDRHGSADTAGTGDATTR